MIRELKAKEEYFFYISDEEAVSYNTNSLVKAFVNDKNFLHNDVGPAYAFDGDSGEWFWDGIYIK